MANTVITYPAQKLTIKSMRGNHFKLVINVKDSGGSNYDFTSDTTDTTLGDDAFFQIYRKDGFPLENSPNDVESIAVAQDNITPVPASASSRVDGNITYSTEDGKITFEWDANIGNYAPWPGKYKYHLGTKDSNNKETVWLYGDFIVTDNNKYVASPVILPY